MQCYTVLGGLTMTRSIVVYLINTVYDCDSSIWERYVQTFL